jgi:hypothetical protein
VAGEFFAFITWATRELFQGPIADFLVKKYSKFVDLKNSVFSSLPIWIFFFSNL